MLLRKNWWKLGKISDFFDECVLRYVVIALSKILKYLRSLWVISKFSNIRFFVYISVVDKYLYGLSIPNDWYRLLNQQTTD